jgi:hypothetical protein
MEFHTWTEVCTLIRRNPHIRRPKVNLGRSHSVKRRPDPAVRMLFDYLVTGGTLPYNPTSSVRGPRHSVSEELAAISRDVEVFSRTGKLPFRNAAAVIAVPGALDGSLADTPFVQRLHWRLARAARTMGDTPRQFIAELIADAVDARSTVVLRPEPFREVLAHRGMDLPNHLVPYGALIQEKLFRFAAARSRSCSLTLGTS